MCCEKCDKQIGLVDYILNGLCDECKEKFYIISYMVTFHPKDYISENELVEGMENMRWRNMTVKKIKKLYGKTLKSNIERMK